MRDHPDRAPAFTDRIEISAGPSEVWRLLTDRDSLRHWMNGATVTSDWRVGNPIAIDWVPIDRVYHDRGTVLASEPPRLLQYSHWTELSRRPDTADARSIVTFTLEDTAPGTILTVSHERVARGGSDRHSRFFWATAMKVIKDLAEGRSAEPITIIRPEGEPEGRIDPR